MSSKKSLKLMESAEPIKRKRGRPALKTGKDRLANTVKIEEELVGKLDAQCKKNKIAKGRFTSAALRYFLDNGLDPTQQTSVPEGTLTRSFLKELINEGRQENFDVGNRVVKTMRAWERDLYKFITSHQTGMVHYLERIEVTLLNQLVTMETRALSTILEQTVSSEIESHMTRVVTERILSKLFGESDAESKETTKQHDAKHDQRLLHVLQELAKKTTVTRPQVAAKPTPVPVPDPPLKPKPAAPTSAPTAES